MMGRLRCSLGLLLVVVLLLIAGACDEKGESQFSFAILTDLHIGRDVYLVDGNEYDRLQRAVEEIKRASEKHKIKFAMILGDIANAGEKAELLRAKEALDGLTVPYFPLLGNHDVWPYSGDPADRYFQDVFNEGFFKKQFEKLGIKPADWQRQVSSNPPWLQNYRLDYQGIHFVGLDFVSREPAPAGQPGVGPWAEPFAKSEAWLRQSLQHQGGKTIVAFSHHPLLYGVDSFKMLHPPTVEMMGRIKADIQKNGNKVINFAGHSHDNDIISEIENTALGIPVILTQDLVLQKKFYEVFETKEPYKFIRIVRVKGKNIQDIDYSLLLPVKGAESIPAPPATAIPAPPTAEDTPAPPTATPVPPTATPTPYVLRSYPQQGRPDKPDDCNIYLVNEWSNRRYTFELAQQQPCTPTPVPKEEYLELFPYELLEKIEAPGLTSLQREEMWKQFKGKRVRWTGEFIGIEPGKGSLVAKFQIGTDAWGVTTLVRLDKRYEGIAAKLSKGDLVVYTGTLNTCVEWATFCLDNGELVALKVFTPLWSKDLSLLDAVGNVVYAAKRLFLSALDAQTGKAIWSRQFGSEEEFPCLLSATQRELYIVGRKSEPPRPQQPKQRVQLLDPATGKTVWTKDVDLRDFDRIVGASEGLVYLTRATSQVPLTFEWEGELVAFEVPSWKAVWSKGIRKTRHALMFAAGSGIAFVGSSMKLEALDAKTGARLWERPPVDFLAIVIDDGKVLLPYLETEYVDARTGRLLWKKWKKTASTHYWSLATFGETVLGVGATLGSSQMQLEALDKKTGKLMWTKTLRGPVGLRASSGLLYMTDSQVPLQAFKLEDIPLNPGPATTMPTPTRTPIVRPPATPRTEVTEIFSLSGTVKSVNVEDKFLMVKPAGRENHQEVKVLVSEGTKLVRLEFPFDPQNPPKEGTFTPKQTPIKISDFKVGDFIFIKTNENIAAKTEFDNVEFIHILP